MTYLIKDIDRELWRRGRIRPEGGVMYLQHEKPDKIRVIELKVCKKCGYYDHEMYGFPYCEAYGEKISEMQKEGATCDYELDYVNN